MPRCTRFVFFSFRLFHIVIHDPPPPFFLQISRGVTTNEEVNVTRYDYFFEVDPENPARKKFYNPFDHGFTKNWADFCVKSGSNSKINWFELYELQKKEYDP